MARPILEVRELCVGSGDRDRVPEHQFRRRGGPGAVHPRGRGTGKSQLLRCIGLDFPPVVGGRFSFTASTSPAPPASGVVSCGPGASSSSTPPPRTACGTGRSRDARRVLIPAAPAPPPRWPGCGKRIQIAKALAHGADALLLDEPFVGVEQGVRDRILELLRRLRTETETTVVVASRDPEVAGAGRRDRGAPRRRGRRSGIGGTDPRVAAPSPDPRAPGRGAPLRPEPSDGRISR